MRRGENQNRQNKKKQSPEGVRKERDCGAQDCQQEMYAGYERLAEMERELEKRKRLERENLKWEWKK